MHLIKPVKHYFLASASLAEWLAVKTDSRTARVRTSRAVKRFRQMHSKINIFYTMLVQNMENGKLHRQVDSVDAGLNRNALTKLRGREGGAAAEHAILPYVGHLLLI